jgi:hypothetical protein
MIGMRCMGMHGRKIQERLKNGCFEEVKRVLKAGRIRE